MSKDNERPSQTEGRRRRFFVQLAVGSVAGCQVQQQKVSKAEAAYQPRPNGPQACGNCTNFIAPSDCRVVQGPVAANGWSRYWRPRAA